MKRLDLVKNDSLVFKGSLIRLFGVKRFDRRKIDEPNSFDEESDFYDYLVVDFGPIKENSFCLINITLDNQNRGSILCEFDDISTDKPLDVARLKKYFGSKQKVLITLNNILQ